MIDIELVRQCYKEFKENQEYYRKIDEYYYGNIDKLKHANKKKWQSDFHCVDNFFQTFVDQESQYSFGNHPTYKYDAEEAENVASLIKYEINNNATYDNALGQRLVELGIVYELNFIGKDGFKNKIITPLEGNMAFDEYDEPIFFIYVHTKRILDKTVQPNKYRLVDYIDVYDEQNVYYLDNTFNYRKDKPPVQHNFPCIPVGVGMIGGNKYTNLNGYIEGDKTIFRMIKTNQDAYSQIKTCGIQEIIDFRNSILKMYGVKLKPKKIPIRDKDGKIIKWEIEKDINGNDVFVEPVIENTKLLYFDNKSKEGAEWLIKDIPSDFIEAELKRCRDDMHSLTNHIDSNEKLQSNISGQALRTRLTMLEAKCKQNIDAMQDIIRTRIRCLFSYLERTNKGKYDYKLVKTEFTPCIPIDETQLADIISKIPQEVVSNYTKRSWLPKIDNPKLEQEIIDSEKKNELNLIGDPYEEREQEQE